MSFIKCENAVNEPYYNLCDFSKCVEHVVQNRYHKPTKTTRFSETWVVKLTTTEPQYATIRVSLSPHSPGVKADNSSPPLIIDKLNRYLVEKQTYVNYIHPLFEYHVCPHFYKPLGFGKDCLYNNIVQHFQGDPLNSLQQKRVLKVIGQVLNSNALRPKNNSLLPLASDPLEEYKSGDVKFQEQSAPNTKWLRRNFFFNTLVLGIPSGRWMPQVPQKNWNVVFQVAVTCYTMHLMNMNHNKLLVKALDAWQQADDFHLTYLIHNTLYRLHCPFLIVANNLKYAQVDKEQFQPYKDFITFLVDYVDRDPTWVNELLPILLNKTAPILSKTTSVLKSQFKSGVTLTKWKEIELLTLLNSFEDILFFISKKCTCEIVKVVDPSGTHEVYTIHPDLFLPNGQVNPLQNHDTVLFNFLSDIPSLYQLNQTITGVDNEIAFLQNQLVNKEFI